MTIDKTLFISDLDGTLLNPDCKITDDTANIINMLIDRGMIFSFATARTQATAKKLTEKINISIPVVLMNGVIVYDLHTEKYVSVEEFPEDSVKPFLETIKKHGSYGFAYTEEDNVMHTYYVNLNTPNAYAFVKERKKKFGKVFTQINDFSFCVNRKIIYYSISNVEEKLRPIYEDLKQIKGLHIDYYRDIYNQDFWYLEVCSENASKFNAITKLKKLYGFEKVVCFGDNLNDIPMFKASDYSCAMENAKEQVKQQANQIIGSNYNNGVANFLSDLFNGKSNLDNI